MVQETMFRRMMQNSHQYTSLKLFCKVSLKCTKLNPFCEYFYTVSNGCYGCCYVEIQLPVCGFHNLNVNQRVITAKSFQNTINNQSRMVNLHVPKNSFSGEKFQCQSISQTHECLIVPEPTFKCRSEKRTNPKGGQRGRFTT